MMRCPQLVVVTGRDVVKGAASPVNARCADHVSLIGEQGKHTSFWP